MDEKNKAIENTETDTIGKILKDIRLKNNISIEKLATHTKIRKENIVSIENDTPLDHIPLTYYRGYIKCYCLFLGIDPDKLLEKLSLSHYATPKNTYSKTNTFHFKRSNRKVDESRKKLTHPRKSYTPIVVILFLAIFTATYYHIMITNKATGDTSTGAPVANSKENGSYISIINIP